MPDRIALVTARLTSEEGYRSDCYDDTDGAPVILASGGSPTIGYGCRCRQWSRAFAAAVLGLQVTDVDTALRAYPWYTGIDEVRGSVLLDVAFNAGVSGLVNGYPKMVAAAGAANWPAMAAECTDANPAIDASRYAPLRQIILTGAA
jgi:hypothetical protein